MIVYMDMPIFFENTLLLLLLLLLLLTVCSYHVTYAFQSEFALYSCLNALTCLTLLETSAISGI